MNNTDDTMQSSTEASSMNKKNAPTANIYSEDQSIWTDLLSSHHRDVPRQIAFESM